MQSKYVEELNGWLSVDAGGNQVLYGADEPADRTLKVDKTMPRNVSHLLRTPEYIRNAANGLVAESMYTLEEGEDWFSKDVRVARGWNRIDLNYNTKTRKGDGSVKSTEKLEVPDSYTGDGCKRFFKNAKTGRHGEVLVQTALELAGVSVELLPMVLNNDYGAVGIDLLLEYPTLNQYGSFDTAGYDVKVHYKEYFTNSKATFPNSLRVDFCHAHERKMKACKQRGYPYKGTIHFSPSGGGMLVIPNRTQNKWTVEMNTWDGKVREQYNAPRSCMRPLAELVKHYTNNTPALRSLNDGILQFSKPINHRRCPLLSKMMSYPKDRLQHETGEQRWQNAVKMMSQHQLPCYIDALSLDAYNAPLETKLSFLDSLSTVAIEEYPDDSSDCEDAYEPDRDWYF